MAASSSPLNPGAKLASPVVPPASTPVPSPSVSTPVAPAEKLSAEEQMALFAKELKENDWGHQPC
ncbi:MAG: hypothetical protein ABIZ49_04040 [Opitutaceae bacterium]